MGNDQPKGKAEIIKFAPGTRISHTPNSDGTTVNASNVLEFITREGEAIEKPIAGTDYIIISPSEPSFLEELSDLNDKIEQKFEESFGIDPNDSFLDANVKIISQLPGKAASTAADAIDGTVDFVVDRFTHGANHALEETGGKLLAFEGIAVVGIIALAVLIFELK